MTANTMPSKARNPEVERLRYCREEKRKMRERRSTSQKEAWPAESSFYIPGVRLTGKSGAGHQALSAMPACMTCMVHQGFQPVSTATPLELHLHFPVFAERVGISGRHCLGKAIQAFGDTAGRIPVFRMRNGHLQQDEIRIVHALRKPGLDPWRP